jgi:hypothetical protein
MLQKLFPRSVYAYVHSCTWSMRVNTFVGLKRSTAAPDTMHELECTDDVTAVVPLCLACTKLHDTAVTHLPPCPHSSQP